MLSQQHKILIVEDEQAIRAGLIDVFTYHGFKVDSAENGKQGLHKALTGLFDLIILDVMLPQMNGFDICKNIRQSDPNQPIIMLTAKTTDEDIIQGLSLGADDYVAKPFSVAQLVLRVQAVLRRTTHQSLDSETIRLSPKASIDIQNLTFSNENGTVQFTKREIQVLVYLHQHNQRPVSRDELLNKVWGYPLDMAIETRTVDIHIAKIRKKIEQDPKQAKYLITVRGAGYKLVENDGNNRPSSQSAIGSSE